MAKTTIINSHFVDIETALAQPLRIHYQWVGQGSPVLLLHGWPTSGYLWRNVMPVMATRHRIIAMDLPGFGLSDKPLNASYNFRFYSNSINSFLNALNIGQTGLVVHDLGGPVGLYWALESLPRLSSLAILNTLVYPDHSWTVKLFLLSTYLPFVKNFLTSSFGLYATFKLGTSNSHRITPALVKPYQAPFKTAQARQALLAAAQGLDAEGFSVIARKLKQIKVPVSLIYGEQDHILPDIARTMARLRCDIAQAELTTFADSGHFLQEDEPEKLGLLLQEFFSSVR